MPEESSSSTDTTSMTKSPVDEEAATKSIIAPEQPPEEAASSASITTAAAPAPVAKRGSRSRSEKKATEKRKSTTSAGSGSSASVSWPPRSEEKRRSHSRTFQTLHTGSKIKHLKKLDGEPLWRTDIQYDFLSTVFHNEQKVFRNSYEISDELFSFADIYIDAMARSSKTSKILCEKLLGDRKAGLNMAMVCLLVNIGRMNTTLNFFPEMRAQLRTYHPIPSLQTYNDQSEYKQLQDAPRLKSILKGACEDRVEPSTLDELAAVKTFPKTNPINLVFLVSTFASRVQDRFFVSPYEFHDLIMNTNLSSESRGRAFLWLMWALLETDLSPERLKENPFGLGQSDGTKVPEFVVLSPEQLTQENVDPEQEIEFGHNMTRERKLYIDSSQQNNQQQFPFINSSLVNPPVTASMKGKQGDSKRRSATDKNAEATESEGTDVRDSEDSSVHGHKDKSSDTFKSEHPNTQSEDETQKSKTKQSSPSKKSARSSSRAASKAEPAASVSFNSRISARDTQCQIEISKMLRIIDDESRRKRKKAGAMYREWMKIKDHDPLYDSDVEDFPEETDEVEKVEPKDPENKEDLANLLVHKKRKRHLPPQDYVHGLPLTMANSAVAGGASTAAGNDAGINYPDINGITYSGPNNENLLSKPYGYHIPGNSVSLAALGYAGLPAMPALPATLGNAGNNTGKLAAKVTVNNRIDYGGDYGEESLARARMFRRSTRWLRAWDAAKRIHETEVLARIGREREKREKQQTQREDEEYEHVQRVLQEERDRLASEIEMEFDMAEQEKKERRHWSRVGVNRTGSGSAEDTPTGSDNIAEEYGIGSESPRGEEDEQLPISAPPMQPIQPIQHQPLQPLSQPLSTSIGITDGNESDDQVHSPPLPLLPPMKKTRKPRKSRGTSSTPATKSNTSRPITDGAKVGKEDGEKPVNKRGGRKKATPVTASKSKSVTAPATATEATAATAAAMETATAEAAAAVVAVPKPQPTIVESSQDSYESQKSSIVTPAVEESHNSEIEQNTSSNLLQQPAQPQGAYPEFVVDYSRSQHVQSSPQQQTISVPIHSPEQAMMTTIQHSPQQTMVAAGSSPQINIAAPIQGSPQQAMATAIQHSPQQMMTAPLQHSPQQAMATSLQHSPQQNMTVNIQHHLPLRQSPPQTMAVTPQMPQHTSPQQQHQQHRPVINTRTGGNNAGDMSGMVMTPIMTAPMGTMGTPVFTNNGQTYMVDAGATAGGSLVQQHIYPPQYQQQQQQQQQHHHMPPMAMQHYPGMMVQMQGPTGPMMGMHQPSLEIYHSAGGNGVSSSANAGGSGNTGGVIDHSGMATSGSSLSPPPSQSHMMHMAPLPQQVQMQMPMQMPVPVPVQVSMPVQMHMPVSVAVPGGMSHTKQMSLGNLIDSENSRGLGGNDTNADDGLR